MHKVNNLIHNEANQNATLEILRRCYWIFMKKQRKGEGLKWKETLNCTSKDYDTTRMEITCHNRGFLKNSYVHFWSVTFHTANARMGESINWNSKWSWLWRKLGCGDRGLVLHGLRRKIQRRRKSRKLLKYEDENDSANFLRFFKNVMTIWLIEVTPSLRI